ncbi:MAG: hypothetical protein Q9202_002437 [Teloschistes flavicans]
MAVTNIDRGSPQAESFSSSARCTLESAPSRYGRGPFKPTRQANPVVDQPLVSNSVKTDEAHLPKHDDKGEEAKDMDERYNAFNQGQFPEECGVGNNSQEQDGPRKQGSLPLTRLITSVTKVD